MIVQKKDDEIVIKFSAGVKASKIQSILDYLRYEELTINSRATAKDLEDLLKQSKSKRWEMVKKNIGFAD